MVFFYIVGLCSNIFIKFMIVIVLIVIGNDGCLDLMVNGMI